jgi:hypothetical protein
MTALVQPLALGELFQQPTGREYALQWYNGNEKGRSGYIRMTDLLFNWCFYPAAFGWDGSQDTRTVTGSSNIKMTRRIGGPEVQYVRAAYTKRVRATFRSSQFDSGTQMFVADGDDEWNFEISGDLAEFRLWLDRQASLNMLRRTLVVRTITGVGSAHVPIVKSV